MSKPPTPAEAERRAREAAGLDGHAVWRGGQSSGDDTADLDPWPDSPNGHQPADPPEPVTLAQVPAYPAGQVPEPLRSFVGWAERDGLHPGLAGGAALAALAMLCGGAEATAGSMTARPSLWIPLHGQPSQAKSPTLNHAMTAYAALYAADRAQYEELVRQRKQAAADGVKPEDLPEVPAPPAQLRLSNVTIEALARRLAENARAGAGCAGAVIADELAAYLGSLGRYGKGGPGADRAQLRELWSGYDVHIQRVGDGGSTNAVDIFLPRPALTICGPLLPDQTDALGSDTTGDRARWLMHSAPTSFVVGKPKETAEPKPDLWMQSIERLYRNRRPREWKLIGPAYDLWSAATDKWREWQEQPYAAHVIEFLRKADRHALAVALVFAEGLQAAWSAEQPPDKAWWTGGDIPAEAMRGAIAVVDYCAGCWLAADSGSTLTLSMSQEKMSGAHSRFLSWLESRPFGAEGLPEGSAPRPRATRKEIQMAQVAGARTPGLVDALITEHRQRFPGCVTAPQPNAKGRPTVYVYAPERKSHNVGQRYGSESIQDSAEVEPQVRELQA